MREIKFRGKRLDNGEMVYGSLIRRIDRTEIFDDVFTWEVDPATVGQFTGLFDKSGNDIYEGDILQLDCFSTYAGSYTKKALVSYEVKDSNDGTQWSWFTLTITEDDSDIAFLRSKKMEIIGNIHDDKLRDNPELLNAE